MMFKPNTTQYCRDSRLDSYMTWIMNAFYVYQCLFLSLPIILLHQTEVQATTSRIRPVILPGAGYVDSCPTRSVALRERNANGQTIRTAIDSAILSFVEAIGTPVSLPDCGEGKWRKIASLNMSDSAQCCPSPWTEIHIKGIRACGRPSSQNGSCSGTFFSPPRLWPTYQNVCGRIIGYEYGSADAFRGYQTLDSPYVYGVSITHGTPTRNHIWTNAAGLTEGAYFEKSVNCPCAHPNHANNSAIPFFVGNNYYCESGNSGSTWKDNFLYANDPLWDGQQCEGVCCDNGKSPPWFSVELPNPTIDDIEVRICSSERTYQDAIVQLMEIYIQ